MIARGAKPGYVQRQLDILLALCIMTVVLCWYITTLIVWKLWKVNQRVTRIREHEGESSPYTRIILVLVECGALYSVWVITYLVAQITMHTPAGWVSLLPCLLIS